MQLPRVLHLGARSSVPRPCRCGHEERAHEHYRRGTDCGLCACRRFQGAAAAQRVRRDAPGEPFRVA